MDIIPNSDKNTITIGNFDGQHVGHRLLFKHAKKIAGQKGRGFTVLSFTPHPAFVLCPNTALRLIDSYDERRESILKNSGADTFTEIPFTHEFAKTLPGDFLKLLADNYGCAELVIGAGYRFGKDRAGEITQYKSFCDEIGIELHIVNHVLNGVEKVASSDIRQLVLEKNFSAAEKLLGRKYRVAGKVENGMKNGCLLGFPTANLITGMEKLLPPDGVYVTLSTIRGNNYLSVTNVGVKPSFGDNARTVESYLLDFSGTIYGEWLSVEFIEYIRPELKFESIDALREQISQDILFAKDVTVC